MTRKKFVCAGAYTLIALAVGGAAAPTAWADKKDDAFNDCIKLCPLAIVVGPEGVAAWAAGCSAGWAASKAACWFTVAGPRGPYIASLTPDTQLYNATGSLSLSAGRIGPLGPLTGAGSVSSVAFYAATVEAHNLATSGAAGQFYTIPWLPLGSGAFNAGTNKWELSVLGSALPSLNGYVLRAEFLDSNIPMTPPDFSTIGDQAGRINAVGFAIIPTPGALALFCAAASFMGIRRRR